MRHDIPVEIQAILATQSTFFAGRLKEFLPAWQALTCDRTLCQCVTIKG